MARDYKNTRRKPEKKPVPGWIWLLTGLMIGLLVALLVYLSQQPGSDNKQASAATKKTKQKTKVVKKTTTDKKGIRYTFYTVLPESEVVIPEQDVLKSRDTSKTSSKKTEYLLQAGSFKRKKDAESLKARLALLGIESTVESVQVHGDNWHRIRIGPFTSLREINATRNRLRNNDLNSILIKKR